MCFVCRVSAIVKDVFTFVVRTALTGACSAVPRACGRRQMPRELRGGRCQRMRNVIVAGAGLLIMGSLMASKRR